MAKALTVRALEALRPGAARREVPDGLVRGLFLIMQPSGKASWAVRYRHRGLPRKLTIGTYPAIDLKAARELGSRALVKVAGGDDPAAEKQAAKAIARTEGQGDRDAVERLAESFVERYAKANTRESSWRETKRILDKEVVPQWRGRRIQDIGRRDIIALLDRIADRGAAIMANRVLATVRRMFGWCVERGVLDVSPCVGVKAPTAERSRDRVLDDAELRLAWDACDNIGLPFGPLVRLLILTGQRRDEVADMRWSEVDLDAKTWTIPRERVKNDAAHVVPLSDAAVAVLRDVPRIASKAGLVFTTTGETAVTGFSRAKDRLDGFMLAELSKGDAEAAPAPHWTFHDLRRTAASGMARLGFPVHVVEAVLNHRSGTIRGVARVYNRYDYAEEKRRALEAWGRYVETLVSGKSADNVTSLASARAVA